MKFSKMFIVGSLVLFGCSSNVNNPDVDSDFKVFYKRFHEDTVFQKERVRFPLPGINTDEMSVLDSNYFWKKENWQIQKEPKIDNTGDFIMEINETDSIVEEMIYSKIPGFVFRRKFKKIEGEWYLIRLEDVNL